MNVLVTGHQGYVGTILVKQLLEQNFQVLGCDTNYFDSTLSENSLKIPNLISDIRNITNEHLKNIDAIFHLAGLSNDPLGELNSKLTNEINYVSTVNLAKRAKESGVKRFVFSSSCSTYGQNDNLVDENSSLEPLTEYAKSKVNSEKKILELNDEYFCVTILRNATVYGTSSNMRLDLVVNNLLASAFVSGKIELLSDGTSWRPLLHVNDMANAFITVLTWLLLSWYCVKELPVVTEAKVKVNEDKISQVKEILEDKEDNIINQYYPSYKSHKFDLRIIWWW